MILYIVLTIFIVLIIIDILLDIMYHKDLLKYEEISKRILKEEDTNE